MYITTPKRKGGITVVRLVHGFRKDGKVKIKIIKTLGQSRDPMVGVGKVNRYERR